MSETTSAPSAAPHAGTGIVVEGVGRSFGAVTAVRSATFTARAGQVTALVGPNGSGKTTLMLMLASLLAPDAGRIRIAGADPVTDAAAVRARTGWMPDVLGSWPSLTVRQTLVTTARLYRLPLATARARAAELIAEVGLTELADRPTKVLSRGQKQRLSLARALVHDPDVLLLDEPASGLDPRARIELRELVRRLAARGKTVLVSSHVLAELDEMADDAVYIDRGETAAEGALARARTTVRPWRIRSADSAAGTAETTRAALVAAGVDAATIGSDRGDLLVPVAGDDAAADLLAALVAAGVRVSAFAPAVGDLEQAFLELGSSSTPGGAR